MARADLHVHSRYSDHPSEWFLQRLGAAESYTEPEAAYAAAKARGMDFVTITDHNRIDGALALKADHPHDVIVGVESTAYFPEDGCKVHLLLWGLDETAFQEVQELRGNVSELAEYVARERIAHSVAHATFGVSDRLRVEHLERLVLLFSGFEVINGSRMRRQNDLWRAALEALTPATIDRLAEKHGREPLYEVPWIKAFTGGSDDHAGLLVGRTWTEADASTPEEFLGRLRSRETTAAGRHNDYRTLAFSIYKIASEFSSANHGPSTRSLLATVSDAMFSEEAGRQSPLSLRERVAVARLRTSPLGCAVADLIEGLRAERGTPLEARLDSAYARIADVADEIVLMLLETTDRHLTEGDLLAFVRDVSAALPALFLSAPFFTTMRALNHGRMLADDVRAGFGVPAARTGKRILWFTDTLDDLNGVSVTLRTMAEHATRSGYDITICACRIAGDEPWILALPPIYELALPYYDRQAIRVPSMLTALRLVQEHEPDEIYVSTPGPVGVLGLLAARLMDLPCRAIYHTDFAAQLSRIGGDDAPTALVESVTAWFYAQFDQVLAPTLGIADGLTERGISREKLGVFRRGVDTTRFAPRPSLRERVRDLYGIPEGSAYVYAGRISRDKELALLIDAHERVTEKHPNVTLVLAGDGPHAEEFKARAHGVADVVFTGRLDQDRLAELYNACDFLVFPSVSDTFGMAVLEAHACGLPALVSGFGGPQEVIVPGRTGRVVHAQTAGAWADAIAGMLALQWSDVRAFRSMAWAARDRALAFDWDEVLAEMAGQPRGRMACAEPVASVAVCGSE